LVVKGGKNKDY